MNTGIMVLDTYYGSGSCPCNCCSCSFSHPILLLLLFLLLRLLLVMLLLLLLHLPCFYNSLQCYNALNISPLRVEFPFLGGPDERGSCDWIGFEQSIIVINLLKYCPLPLQISSGSEETAWVECQVADLMNPSVLRVEVTRVSSSLNSGEVELSICLQVYS